MQCPKCHSKINEDSKYCSHCGKKITANENKNKHIKQSNHYLRAYIGKNYYTIKKEKPSLPAFFLGPFYLVYRKLWLYALVIFLTDYFLITYTTKEITTFMQILIHIYLGFQVNKIYLDQAKRKTMELKKSNPTKSKKELLELCEKQGGTTITYLVISIILLIIYLFVLISSLNNKQKIETPSPNTTTNQIDKMTYTIKEQVEPSKHNNKNYHHYIHKNNNSYCSITVSTNKYINLYKTANDYLANNISSNIKEGTTHNTYNKVENNIWTTSTITNNKQKDIYHAILYNNEFYIIETKIYKDKFSECQNLDFNLLSSTYFS